MSSLEVARQCGEKMWSKDAASHALGIEVDIPQAGSAVARMCVRQDMLNGFEICHGGLILALADTAFAFACNAYDDICVAASVQTEFVRPAYVDDRLLATASQDYRGRKAAYYTVRIQNQDAALVALFRGRAISTGKPLLTDSK